MAAPHRELLAKTLDRVMAGEIKRLVINMPYRHWKTQEAVVNLISRVFAVNPRAKCWHSTYSMELVRNNSRQILQILQSEQFLDCFDARIGKDSSAQNHWETAQGGSFHGSTPDGYGTTGFGAGIGGDPYDGVMVLDDMQEARRSTSQAHRSAARAGTHNLITTRLNHRDTPVIFIQQRLAMGDVTDFLLSGGTGDVWDTLCLQGISETGRPPEHYKAYSHCRLIDYTLEPGALFPAKMDRDDWYKVRDAVASEDDDQPLGAQNFAAQVQQNPTDNSISLYDASWLRGYETLPHLLSVVNMRLDTAQKGTGDHNGLVVFGENTQDKSVAWVLDADRRRCEFPELVEWVCGHINRIKAMETLTTKFVSLTIEDANIGAALKAVLDERMAREKTRISIKLTPKNGDKFSRAMECLPYFQQGRVYMPTTPTRFCPDISKIRALKEEFGSFTTADTHTSDDMLDPLVWEVLTRFGSKAKFAYSAFG